MLIKYDFDLQSGSTNDTGVDLILTPRYRENNN